MPAVDFFYLPVYISKVCLLPAEIFCECFITNEIRITETGRIRSATRVIRGLIESIMTSTPIIVVTE